MHHLPVSALIKHEFSKSIQTSIVRSSIFLSKGGWPSSAELCCEVQRTFSFFLNKVLSPILMLFVVIFPLCVFLWSTSSSLSFFSTSAGSFGVPSWSFCIDFRLFYISSCFADLYGHLVCLYGDFPSNSLCCHLVVFLTTDHFIQRFRLRPSNHGRNVIRTVSLHHIILDR